MKMTRQNWM